MKRRSMLKRVSAVGLGAGTAGLAVGTSSNDESDDEVRFEGAIVHSNGKVYAYRADVDPKDVSIEDCCSCDTNGATDCDPSCDCCEYCHIK